MKNLFFLSFLILLSFVHNETLKDGRYLSENAGDAIYAIDISNNTTDIKFYLRENDGDNTNDWKTFGTGKIVKVKDKYFVEDIKSKNIPYDAEKKVEIKIKGNNIEFKTFNLMAHLYHSFNQFSNTLSFELQSK